MKLHIDELGVMLAGRRILDRIGLHARPGEFVGLVGPNGSGKSTLLRTIYRSLRPDRGEVLVGGDNVWQLSTREAARRTAAVLQDNTTPSGLTVAEIVALGRTAHRGLLGRDGADDREAVGAALERTGVREFEHRPFTSLSGGERQRVLLARALAQQPRVLVLDEPTNHLDVRAKFELLDLVRDIGTATAVTTLAVLHDLDLAARSCDRLVVLDGGRVAAAGPVLDVLTPRVFRDVFGVNAAADRHPDGVVRITYHADPLSERDTEKAGDRAGG